MKRISTTTALLLALAGPCAAEEAHVDPLDLDEALARQMVDDLIDGVTSAYDCGMLLRTFRGVGNEKSPVYLVEVQASGPECEEAMLLLARSGSDRNLLFRRWEPAPDVKEVDPIKRPN